LRGTIAPRAVASQTALRDEGPVDVGATHFEPFFGGDRAPKIPICDRRDAAFRGRRIAHDGHQSGGARREHDSLCSREHEDEMPRSARRPSDTGSLPAVGLIHSRGHLPRGGYCVQHEEQAGRRAAREAPPVHGWVQGRRRAPGAGRGQDGCPGRTWPRPRRRRRRAAAAPRRLRLDQDAEHGADLDLSIWADAGGWKLKPAHVATQHLCLSADGGPTSTSRPAEERRSAVVPRLEPGLRAM